MAFITSAIFILGLACIEQSQAMPGTFPPYRRPQPGDARSACPGINAMANHGWLPHDGRNITEAMLAEALRGAFAFDTTPPPPGNATPFAQTLFAESISDPANPSRTSFDLDTINTHGAPIEFDGSLSRRDHYFGGDVAFDRPTWDTQWRLFEDEGFVGDGGAQIDLAAAATARARHVLLKSRAGNPEFNFTEVTFSKSAGTTALYMMVLGGTTGFVNKDWVWALFAEERIPYDEGFTPQDNVSTTSLGPLVESIMSAPPTDLLCSFNPDVHCPGNSSSSTE